jgi:predicted enzyme related to lactoylglutathione lyase
MSMNPVVHFEMPLEDAKRLIAFYRSVFGWQMRESGPEMGNYVMATTSEVDEKGRPKVPGAINGGFFPKDMDRPAQYPSVVIAVEDIKDCIQRITVAGGKVLGDPVEIPGVGEYVSFLDTEGNRASILKPKEM